MSSVHDFSKLPEQYKRFIPLGKLSRELGVDVSLPTAHRWTMGGIQDPASGGRIVLKSMMIGGRKYTREDWLAEFIEARNGRPNPAPTVTAAQRERQVPSAERSLEAAGW